MLAGLKFSLGAGAQMLGGILAVARMSTRPMSDWKPGHRNAFETIQSIRCEKGQPLVEWVPARTMAEVQRNVSILVQLSGTSSTSGDKWARESANLHIKLDKALLKQARGKHINVNHRWDNNAHLGVPRDQ